MTCRGRDFSGWRRSCSLWADPGWALRAGIKTGRFPKPVKLGPRTTAWKVEDIRTLIEKAE
jgi:hypothetical protein